MTAAIHFLPAELGRWDGANVDALALAFFSDERPLRGAAGLADWRLCGRLSRLLKAGRATGCRGETLLLPPARGRLPFPRIILFGLGDTASFDEHRYREDVRALRGVLRRAGIARYAVQPPGRSTGLIAARRALELWLEVARQDGWDCEATLIESPGGQREMAEALRGRAQRRQ